MTKTLATSSLLIASSLVLTLTVTDGAKAQDDTTITTLYTSMLSGVGKSTGSQTVTWAMSAIGLAGGDSSQLGAISEELQEIDAELVNINATLNEILDAIEEQTCTETQIAPSLQDAVNDITNLYNDYQTYLVNTSMDPSVPPSQEEVLLWQNNVLTSVPSDLNDIHNGVYATVNANVIDECAVATAASYINAKKTNETFLDDRPSYSQLVDIVNYYYGIQVEGATILAEAYHLQACQAAAADDPDLHCDFSTASTSTSASDANEICDDPTNTNVQRACLAAEEAVTDPTTGTGMYERVEAQLTAAGAPYSTGEAVTDDPRQVVTGELGLFSSIDGSSPLDWSSSYAYLFPKDLFDFTNTTTLNGEQRWNCTSPLSSIAPCGPVGIADANFNSGDTYAGHVDWKAVTADILLQLFAPYNDKNSNGFDFSGVLGDYMYSIGFSEATKTNGLIVTTANYGKNKDTGLDAICFMDTAAPRDKAEQPWCDGIDGEVQGTDNLIDQSNCPWVQSKYLDSIGSFPEWYALEVNCDNGKISPAPGWFNQVQDEDSTYWQFHWPMLDVSQISCQQGKPYTNPGGLLSRCDDDLQAYVDALLPPPDSETTALAASGDTTLLHDEPNTNTGRDHVLAVGSRGADEFVVQFSDDRIQRFREGGKITSAILRVAIAEPNSPRLLEIVPIRGGFVEGNGVVGTGATWNCAEDANVSDDVKDCLQSWPISRFANTDTHWPDEHDRREGFIGWDVTKAVRYGIHAWLIRTPSWQGHDRGYELQPIRHTSQYSDAYRLGHGHGYNHQPIRRTSRYSAVNRHARAGTYYSREGAASLHDPTQEPTLLLARNPRNAR